jgi:dienelactone hydrolase
MLPFAAVATAAAPTAAVGMLRYRVQGWNGSRKDAAKDLRDVLGGLAGDSGRDIDRVLLIGHSMGGRAVLDAAASPLVTGVCALAPWLPSGEALADLGGRRIVFAHGDADTTTDFASTAQFVRRCRERGWPAAFFTVPGEQHNMLRSASAWDDVVGRFVTAEVSGTGDPLLDEATTTDVSRPPTLLSASERGTPWRGVASVAAAAATARAVPRWLAVRRDWARRDSARRGREIR